MRHCYLKTPDSINTEHLTFSFSDTFIFMFSAARVMMWLKVPTVRPLHRHMTCSNTGPHVQAAKKTRISKKAYRTKRESIFSKSTLTVFHSIPNAIWVCVFPTCTCHLQIRSIQDSTPLELIRLPANKSFMFQVGLSNLNF